MKSWTLASQLRPLSIVSGPITKAISVGILLSFGIATTNVQGGQANPIGLSLQRQEPPVAITLPSTGLKDGIYVYGRAQQPDQLRTEYMVFQVQNQRVTGAVYEPRSAYDCFQGTVSANRLDVKVLGYDDQVFEHQVNLNAYYALPQVSANDSRLLSACLNNSTITAWEQWD